jgi:hypothetical protein
MKRHTLRALLLLVVIGLAGCDNAPTPPATTLPEPPTLAPTDPALATVAVLPTAVPATDAPPTAELPPTDLPTGEPTAVPSPTLAVATAEATAPATEAPTETAPAEDTPVAAGNLIAPGQRDTASLVQGEARTYLYRGTQFQPAVFFAEPSAELDIQLLVLTGEFAAGTGLDGATPLATADNALAGRPEIVVLSPESNGLFTFAVRAGSGAGDFTAYLFDLTSPATGMAVQQADVLAAGETKRFDVTSNGARPVIAMVDPTDLSDVALDIFGADGALLTTANFSGPGGVEVAYVLPLGTTSYTVAVREATGAAAAVNVAVVTLE